MSISFNRTDSTSYAPPIHTFSDNKLSEEEMQAIESFILAIPEKWVLSFDFDQTITVKHSIRDCRINLPGRATESDIAALFPENNALFWDQFFKTAKKHGHIVAINTRQSETVVSEILQLAEIDLAAIDHIFGGAVRFVSKCDSLRVLHEHNILHFDDDIRESDDFTAYIKATSSTLSCLSVASNLAPVHIDSSGPQHVFCEVKSGSFKNDFVRFSQQFLQICEPLFRRKSLLDETSSLQENKIILMEGWLQSPQK